MTLKVSEEIGEIKPIPVKTGGSYTQSTEYLIPFSTIREKVEDDQYLQIYIIEDEYGNIESTHLLIKEVRDETAEETKKREDYLERMKKETAVNTYQNYLRLKEIYDNMTSEELKELQ